MAGEKRTKDQEETLLSETVVLVDIEGTTTSISFVKDTLFPYVRENLKKYVESKWEDEEFKKDFEKLKEQAKKDEEDKVDGVVSIAGANPDEEKESLVKNVFWQMDADRKTGALKQLQGHMWREAYNSGTVKGHVYEDVPKALESWTNDGRKVYVYSSGSVEAQKLLFGHTVCGDLLKYFSGYFDTEVGAKQESSSYKNILSKIGAEPSSVIFLTDVVKEAQAAKEAGLTTTIVLREGNAPITDEERVTFTTIKSFLDLSFQISTKRQKLDTSEPAENSTKTEAGNVEPMDTSEDVDMSDVSEKKVTKNQTKEVVESEVDENTKTPSGDATPTVAAKSDESMVVDGKDVPTAEKVSETDATEKSDTEKKTNEVSTKADTSEKAQVAVTENPESTPKPPEDNASKSETVEKAEKSTEEVVEKVAESTSAETTPAVNDPSDVETCKTKTTSESVTATEEKMVESTEKDTKENANKTEKKVEAESEEKSVARNSEGKVEDAGKPKKEDEKEQSSSKVISNSNPVESKKSEAEDKVGAKTTQDSGKAEEKASVTENGDVPTTNTEKVTVPTITESEANASKTDRDTESKVTADVAAEVKSEGESKSTEEKSVKANEEVTATVNDTVKPEASVDTSKETKEESVKEETVVDEVKDKNTVDSEKKKLNGTTQNGDADVTVSDEKLHRNGLNEGSSDEKLKSTTSENTSAQNGEPESSSEASAESIKVKKVVDSTIADGAGEPDVVPPVVVAATS